MPIVEKPITKEQMKKLSKILPGSVFEKEASKPDKKKDFEKIFNKKKVGKK